MPDMNSPDNHIPIMTIRWLNLLWLVFFSAPKYKHIEYLPYFFEENTYFAIPSFLHCEKNDANI